MRKITIKATVFSVIMGCAAFANAQPTTYQAAQLSVYGGMGIDTSPQAQQNFVRELGFQYEQIVRETGLNAQNPYEAVSAWCSNLAEMLEGAQSHAALVGIQGDYQGAYTILKRALVLAAQGQVPGSMRHAPFMRLSAIQGATIISKIEALGLGGSLSATNALDQIVSNVINVAYKFDEEHYVPFRYQYGGSVNNCGRCQSGFVERMQLEALRFAAHQTSSIANALTVRVGGEYRPVGDARVYLNAAEVTANMTALDLRNNIFAAQIPCTIRTLSNTGGQLANFNRGQSTYYRSVKQAVNDSSYFLRQASSNISLASCSR